MYHYIHNIYIILIYITNNFIAYVIVIIMYQRSRESFTLSIVTFTEINKTSGLFGKQEYFPHLQLFIVLHIAKRLSSLLDLRRN